MASAAPAQAEQASARPSFAKVAASALKTPVPKPKDSALKARPPVATPRIPAHAHRARSTSTNGEAPKTTAAAHNGANRVPEPLGNTAAISVRKVEPTQPPVATRLPEAKLDGSDRPQSLTITKVTAAEDGGTQLSSSVGSGKPPSIDGKSVASGTTFALDEKESLRPDDSASLRAVEEEDVTSPPDSVVADSRQGSDNGAARAFRDQLHEIAVMNPQPHRGVPPGRFPTIPIGPQALYDPSQSLNGARSISQPLVHGPPNMPAIPDEKLLEALQSPRDRLFVVKIEQDFIDFIKDSRENEYSLPNCNTFYRMLAHRLADYYLLGHVVDNAMTGVKITRTPYCRIPPSVSQMVDPAKGNNTPPVELPARKIMRRDDGKSGTNTTANSQNPSKTTSEIGGSDGSNDGTDNKDKAALTREEREARYREARKRIFGEKSEDTETTDCIGSGDEKEKDKVISRSSSTSGKKKVGRKMRNYDDDDFQARSRFNAYYPQKYPVPGYPADNVVYYNNFSGPVPDTQYTGMNASTSPPTSYSNPYPAMLPSDSQPQTQYAWNGQPYQPSNNNSMMYSGYGQVRNGNDLSADFQRGMSLQSVGMPSQVTPKMANPQMATYQDTYQPPQHMSMNHGWPQVNQQPSFQVVPSSFSHPEPGSRPMFAPQPPQAPASYQYAFTPNGYSDKPNRNQHPAPGSYTRPQFNPQTQSFIPHGVPSYIGQGPPQMTGYGGFQTAGPYPMSVQVPRPSPPTHSTPLFGSPQSMQGSGSGSSMNRIASQPGDVSSRQNSIAKYGTPSHLPPKPPAPVLMQQSAPKIGLPSMTRVSSNMATGMVNNSSNSQAGPHCASTGPATLNNTTIN